MADCMHYEQFLRHACFRMQRGGAKPAPVDNQNSQPRNGQAHLRAYCKRCAHRRFSFASTFILLYIFLKESTIMAMKKLAAVLGATRGQGASVVKALLQTGRYGIRGITPDGSSPEAHRLRDQGVEVVEVDLSVPGEVVRAFASAHAVFAVTTMYNGNMEREVQQGKNIANAAAATKELQHLVWSTLPSASAVSAGKLKVPHMDGKAQVDEYIIKELPALAAKTTFYWGGLYAENVTYPSNAPSLLMGAQKHVWVQPVKESTVVPMVGDHSINTGIFVRCILEKPEQCLPARYVLGVVDWLAHGAILKEWANLLSAKEDKDIEPVYIESDIDTVGLLWPGGGKELGQILQLSEAHGKHAWSKEGVSLLTREDLGLEVGKRDTDLVSTHQALETLASKL